MRLVGKDVSIFTSINVANDASILGDAYSNSFITIGGNSNQFVKGDGSLDDKSYIQNHNGDPSLLDNPPAGEYYYGSYLGRLWQLDSNGEIQWYINENDLIDLAFGQSIDAKFRSQVLNELGNLYANNGVSFIGKLKSLKIMNKVALLLTPEATKSGILFSVLPFDTGKFICQRASEATQVNEFGQLEVVKNDIPRIDYSGTRIS